MNWTNNCCFCGKSNIGHGNSTWPIYYERDGETHRCCDHCNSKYVITCRLDKTQIMNVRAIFGIEYEGDILKNDKERT